MKNVCFVINDISEFDFTHLIKKYLSNVSISISESFPSNPENYLLIVLWSYKKIIPNIGKNRNVIVFHSSDLPTGKGWAPIYNTIMEKQNKFVISGIFADDEVDCGDVIVKAEFEMRSDYTAETLRKWDKEICIILINKILDKFNNSTIIGKPQKGKSTFRNRRHPSDNEFDINKKFISIVDHLRASESRNPAFFIYNGIKYLIKIEPEHLPEFPQDFKIYFYDSTQ